MYIEVHISLLFYRSYPFRVYRVSKFTNKNIIWQQRATDENKMFPVCFLLFKVCPKFYVRANGTLSIDYSIKKNWILTVTNQKLFFSTLTPLCGVGTN